MKIYSFPTFNLAKVLFTAEELGLDYQLHLLNPAKGEHKTPEHIARQPLGKVPAIEIDGQCYFESHSICRLLAELNGNRLYGDTPQERAVVNQCIDMIGYHQGRWMSMYFWEELIKPAGFKQATDPKAVEEAGGFIKQQMPAVEAMLSRHDYLARDELTIADTIFLAFCQIPSLTSLSLADYPAITKWLEHMSARPATQRALERLPGRTVSPFGARVDAAA